jgi:hypothetical protein
VDRDSDPEGLVQDLDTADLDSEDLDSEDLDSEATQVVLGSRWVRGCYLALISAVSLSKESPVAL